METVRKVAGGDEQLLLSCCCLAESAMMCKRLHQADGSIHLQHWHKSVWMWEHVVLGFSLINTDSVLRLMLSAIPAVTTRGGDWSTTTFFFGLWVCLCCERQAVWTDSRARKDTLRFKKQSYVYSLQLPLVLRPLCVCSHSLWNCVHMHMYEHTDTITPEQMLTWLLWTLAEHEIDMFLIWHQVKTKTASVLHYVLTREQVKYLTLCYVYVYLSDHVF